MRVEEEGVSHSDRDELQLCKLSCPPVGDEMDEFATLTGV